MSDQAPGLLRIGDFSRFSLLSIRMLRHYDERGLLQPAYVDESSGYRFYEPLQLQTASRIRELRDAGCGIAQIGDLLPLFADAYALEEALVAHARSLDAAAEKISEQRALVTRIINQLKENTMSITVDVRTVPALRVLSRRRVLPDYHAEGEAWVACNDALIAKHVNMADFGTVWGATFYDEDYKDQDVDVALWGEFHGDYTSDDDFTLEELPERKVAWARMVGPYEQTGAVCQAIGAWISEHGYTPDGPMFNIYVVGPTDDPNPANWVTDINYPVA